MSRPIFGLLTALLAAVALAACGGGGDEETTTADFRKDYAPISAAIRGLGTEVGAAVTSAKGKSDLELQEQFADLADRANVVADDLEEAKTPDDAAINGTRADARRRGAQGRRRPRRDQRRGRRRTTRHAAEGRDHPAREGLRGHPRAAAQARPARPVVELTGAGQARGTCCVMQWMFPPPSSTSRVGTPTTSRSG